MLAEMEQAEHRLSWSAYGAPQPTGRNPFRQEVAIFPKRSRALTKKQPIAARPVAKRSVPAKGRAAPVNETKHNVATSEEFDRESMGIAAKE